MWFHRKYFFFPLIVFSSFISHLKSVNITLCFACAKIDPTLPSNTWNWRKIACKNENRKLCHNIVFVVCYFHLLVMIDQLVKHKHVFNLHNEKSGFERLLRIRNWIQDSQIRSIHRTIYEKKYHNHCDKVWFMIDRKFDPVIWYRESLLHEKATNIYTMAVWNTNEQSFKQLTGLRINPDAF